MTTSNARPLALVTGASSGIGANLARELANDGHDLILCARRVEPMQALADELKPTGADCTIIAADLSKSGAAGALVREIEARALAVDVLINNAGLGDNGRFDRSDPARITGMLQVNVMALTELTRLLLPPMVARGKGKVMLVASTAAFQPGPQMAVYCASKTYVLSFGEAIAHELRNSGVSVTTLCPGATATEFADVAGAGRSALFKGGLLPVMDAKEVARIGYQGLKSGRGVVITGVLNQLMATSSRLSPTPVSIRIADWMMSSGK
jgi:short-subunit dehydrogenase